MFERFTERARQAMVRAGDEARGLGHHAIGTEHILLGLLGDDEGHAGRALDHLGITAERVRARVVAAAGSGPAVVPGQIPFTAQGRKALSLALSEAVKLGHDHIGTEHLLLAIAGADESLAAGILLELDVDRATIGRTVMREIALGRSRASIHEHLDRMASGEELISRVAARRLVWDTIRRHDPHAEAELGPAAWQAMLEEILDASPEVEPAAR